MIYRGRYDNIIFEFSLPEAPKGVVVICDGVPSVPKQKDVMVRLNSYGYTVIYPRYQGTWESGGEFLARAPTDDINSIIKMLKNGSLTELYSGKNFTITGPIHVLGSSLGGSIALSLLDNLNIDKIIGLSPIIDFKTHNKNGDEQDLAWLRLFIQQAFNRAYRFSNENWDKMMAGEVFNPKHKIDLSRRKDILIAYDLSDREVNYKNIEEYCAQNKIKNIITKNTGHLSFSKIPDSVWGEISYFLESN